MYVPNYVPEPLEVPGNVTQDTYLARVRFIKLVTALHLLSLAAVTVLCMAPLPQTGLIASLTSLGALLILLELLRISLRGRKSEAVVSAALLPIVLLFVSAAATALEARAVPVWCVLFGPAFCGVYTLLCGRDYSFIGCLCLSLVGSSTALAGCAIACGMSERETMIGLGLNFVYLVYFVYDLAALLARRRQGEAFAAVVDLYRDVFNVFGYLVRVIGHWRKHKIWVAPR